MFKKYRKTQLTEMRPYVNGESLREISIAKVDIDAGSPRIGDMVARNPSNPDDQWLISKKYFLENFVEASIVDENIDFPEKEPIGELDIPEKPKIVDDDEVTG